MKIKYNFGLLKNQSIGFLNTSDGTGYHGTLRNVQKKGSRYRFVYDENYIEISEQDFLRCRLKQIDDIYYFIPDRFNLVSPLFIFSMYDTYGFPMEITEEILVSQGLIADTEGFHLIRKIQKEKTKDTFKTKNAF